MSLGSVCGAASLAICAIRDGCCSAQSIFHVTITKRAVPVTVGTALFHTEFFNSVSFVSKLSDFVYCFSQTGNLSGSGVFMIYALGSSLVDNCGCVQQCSLCSSLSCASIATRTFLTAVLTEDLIALFLSALVWFTKILFFADLIFATMIPPMN